MDARSLSKISWSLLLTGHLRMHSNLFGLHPHLPSIHLLISNYPCFVETASQTYHKDSEMSNVVFRQNTRWSFAEQVWNLVFQDLISLPPDYMFVTCYPTLQ